MRIVGYTLFITLLLSAAGVVKAQSGACPSTHKVERGDSLSKIAKSVYKNPSKWALIYKANKDEIGENPSILRAGMVLTLPCSEAVGAKILAKTAVTPKPALKPSPSKGIRPAATPAKASASPATPVKPVRMDDASAEPRIPIVAEYRPETLARGKSVPGKSVPGDSGAASPTTSLIRPVETAKSGSAAAPKASPRGAKIAAFKTATAPSIANPAGSVGRLELLAAVQRPHIHFVTADDYRPFTDRTLPGAGLITEVVVKAMKTLARQPDAPRFSISWVNDWSSHLRPLIASGAFDMGFPWFRPPCENFDQLAEPAQFRCKTFHFSRPVFEILVLFFKRKDGGFKFETDIDIVGKRICRPQGYFTFDLDKAGRNWVKERKISLVQPLTVDECFQLLARGGVDAVALNEFTGRAAIKKLKLGDKIDWIQKPVSIESLHVVVAKTHPRGRVLMHYVNEGIAKLQKSGEYEKIVRTHLTRFWAQ